MCIIYFEESDKKKEIIEIVVLWQFQSFRIKILAKYADNKQIYVHKKWLIKKMTH